MPTHKLYNGEVTLDFDEDKHVYRINGEEVEGVTNALNVISKPALINWAAKMSAEYIERNLVPGKALNEIEIKELCRKAKFAHREKKQSAADIGSMVHALIETYIKNKGKVGSVIHPEVNAGFNAFKQWIDENKVEFHASEQKVYSKTHKFCGTFDFIATVNGKRMMGDIKTSSGIYHEMFLQTSAYQLARQEEFPDEVFEGHVIVNCRKTGELDTRISYDYDTHKEAFLCALGLSRKLKQMEGK